MRKTVLMIGILAALASCEYRTLEDAEVLERADFTLSFRHENVDSVPSEYRVAFYPADERTLGNITRGYMLFDLRTGDRRLSLPAGRYRVTAWNHDTERVLTNGYGNKNTVSATTQQYRPHGAFDTPTVVDSLYGGKTILDYPDYMVHANVEDFMLRAGTDGQVLTLHPDSMVVAVDVNIGGIRGLSDVMETRGSISNAAGRRYIAGENVTEDSVVVIFDCTAMPEENRMTAHFHLFGLEPAEAGVLSHKMILYFWMRTGRVYIPIDVTNLVRRAGKDARRLEVTIEDLGIDLREYVTAASGYEVAVDEWDDIRIGIDL